MTLLHRISLCCALVGTLSPLWVSPAMAASPGASAGRWAASFDAFDAADRARAPRPGGVVFVGSSSIRLWNDLEGDFSALPVVYKRGFGGSRMLDCAQHAERLVLPYQPKVVLVYAGDNDLAEGRSPTDVLKSFTSFVERVRADLPDTRIAYISIKPSPSRAQLLPQIQATNDLIKTYTATLGNADYIDIFTPMLQASGQPRGELFSADRLHMNATGYALWRRVISEHLPAAPSGGVAVASAGAVPAATPVVDAVRRAAAASAASTALATQ